MLLLLRGVAVAAKACDWLRRHPEAFSGRNVSSDGIGRVRACVDAAAGSPDDLALAYARAFQLRAGDVAGAFEDRVVDLERSLAAAARGRTGEARSAEDRAVVAAALAGYRSGARGRGNRSAVLHAHFHMRNHAGTTLGAVARDNGLARPTKTLCSCFDRRTLVAEAAEASSWRGIEAALARGEDAPHFDGGTKRLSANFERRVLGVRSADRRRPEAFVDFGEFEGALPTLATLESPRVAWSVVVRNPALFTVGHPADQVVGGAHGHYTPTVTLALWLGFPEGSQPHRDHHCCLPSFRESPTCAAWHEPRLRCEDLSKRTKQPCCREARNDRSCADWWVPRKRCDDFGPFSADDGRPAGRSAFDRDDLDRAKGRARRFAVVADLDDLHAGLRFFCDTFGWKTCDAPPRPTHATASKSLANVLADHGYTREHFADVADAAQLPLELYYYCRELLRDDTRRLTRTRPAGPTGARSRGARDPVAAGLLPDLYDWP